MGELKFFSMKALPGRQSYFRDLISFNPMKFIYERLNKKSMKFNELLGAWKKVAKPKAAITKYYYIRCRRHR